MRIPAIEMRSVDVFVPSAAAPGRSGPGHAEGDENGRTYLLRDVNWTVHAGEHWVVLGPNGAGKSTLLSVASARRHPSNGAASVLGGRLGSVDVWSLHCRIGLVDWRLAPPGYLEARSVVATGLRGTIEPRHESEAGTVPRVAGALALVDGVPLASRRFDSLSRGEQTRVLIARALVGEPELLVLDEPAIGLDLPGREDLLSVLTRLAAERPALATVLVAHLLEEVAPSVTHALLVSGGRVLAAGPASDVLTGERLSACYGRPLVVVRHGGRLSALSAGHVDHAGAEGSGAPGLTPRWRR